MPNWCDNSLTIWGTKEKIEELKTVITEYITWSNEGHPSDPKCKHPKPDGTPMGFLYYCKPEPDYTVTPVAKAYPEIGAEYADTEEERQKILKNEPTIRSDSWWDWRVVNWGTKWELSDIEIHDTGEDYLAVCFNSAWGPPVDAYKALLEQEGIINIVANYYESGMQFAGLFKDGKDHTISLDTLTKEDFEKNEVLWELQDCYDLYRDIMCSDPLQLHPELEPILRGLGNLEDSWWGIDYEDLLKIYEALKDIDIEEGSISLIPNVIDKVHRSGYRGFTFNNKEYEL